MGLPKDQSQKSPAEDIGKKSRFLQFLNHLKLVEWLLCVKHHTIIHLIANNAAWKISDGALESEYLIIKRANFFKSFTKNKCFVADNSTH
ncbi:hypothetical protein A3196_15270 [Candidatus Thiodiazotropha endoloripes]|uniref:Uncharacterized protein n=1 Tax=Candidatus Thiodiazotropha endoloripes TaxID=1818881 RepID=A0A1E2UTD5_9GAMM|nr:hypothetical protein A3196_15270 [Candidatus Thiodiazotropha endoloripes]